MGHFGISVFIDGLEGVSQKVRTESKRVVWRGSILGVSCITEPQKGVGTRQKGSK